MKRRPSGLFALLFLSATWIHASLAGVQESVKEEALRALRSQDYALAIKICRVQLGYNPREYDFNFLLSRAYAFSGQWQEALGVLDKMAVEYPGNTDVMLFRARIHSWQRDFRQAETGYGEVLRLRPGNAEALTGLAEIASWQGDYAKAISIYNRVSEQNPDQADLAFRLGRVYLWNGNYNKARENYRKALSLDPQNPEYERALQTASARWQDKYELRYEHQAESFSDGRKSYIDQRLALQLKLGRPGPLILKANTTERFDKRDSQFEIELYPRLWRRAYGYLDMAYSPKAAYYTKTSYLLELYQGLYSSWEISLGYRRMNFPSQAVSIYLGSLGYYYDRYIAFLRWYSTPSDKGDAFSWTANLRRYFPDSSYLFIGYGRGSKPFDIVTIEDWNVTKSWVVFAGFDWSLFQKIRLQLNYTYRDEGELRRNLFYVGTGYRW